MATTSSLSLYIPIRESDECVSVPLSPLPSDPHDLIDLLKLELAHPDLWLEFCRQYYRRGRIDEFSTILSVITGQEATDAYRVYKPGDFKSSWPEVLNTLAAWETIQGVQANEATLREAKFSSAISRLNEAAEIDIHRVTTWVHKGFLLFYEGDVKAAESNFNNAIQSGKIGRRGEGEEDNSVLPLIGRALCCVATEKYREALKCFQLAVKDNGDFPIDILLGFAYCHFKMGNFEKALTLFQRVNSSSADHCDALVGIATIKLNMSQQMAAKVRERKKGKKAKEAKEGEDDIEKMVIQQAELYREAYELISRAYSVNPSHCGVLLLLSSHYFYRGEFARSRMLAARALEQSNQSNPSAALTSANGETKDGGKGAASSMDPLTRSVRFQSLFEIGRSYHADGDLSSAHVYYQQAKVLIPQLQSLLSSVSATNVKKDSSSSSTSPLPAPYAVLLFCLSQTHYQRRELNDCRSLLNLLIKYYPHDYHIHRMLGTVLYDCHEYRDASQHFGRALQSDPSSTFQSFGVNSLSLSPTLDSELQLEYAQSLQMAAASQENPTEKQQMLTSSSSSYQRAFSILKASNIPITADMSNNFAVLCHQLGQYEEAEIHYKLAIKSSTAIHFAESGDENRPDDGRPLSSEDVSALYNWGLSCERMGKLQQARRIYKLIRHVFPKYIDATLRLAIMISSEGDSEETSTTAIKLISELLTIDPHHIGVMTQLGCEYMKKGDFNQAAKQFMQIMKETTKSSSSSSSSSDAPSSSGDSYAKVALGNIQYLQGTEAARKAIHLTQMMSTRPTPPPSSSKSSAAAAAAAAAAKEQQKIQSLLSIAAEHFERAGKYFRSVLSSDPSNYLACNGLSLVLVSEGKFNEAREFFSSIRDARHDFDDATINLGCVYVQQQQYMQAITLFNMVLEKMKYNRKKEKNAPSAPIESSITGTTLDYENQQKLLRVEFYVAKTHYLAGQLVECQKILKSLLHHHPFNVEYWYNLALSMEEMAISILQKPKNERSLDEVEDAVNQLTQAGKIFIRLQKMEIKEANNSTATNNAASSSSSLSSSTSTSVLSYIQVKSSTHREFCQMSLSAATPHLNAARQREAELKRWKEETQQARIVMEQKMKEEEDAQQRRKEEEKKKAAEIARAAKERVGHLQEAWIAEWRENQREKEREKGDKEDDDFVVNDENEDALGLGIGSGESEYREGQPKGKEKGKEKKLKNKKRREGNDVDASPTEEDLFGSEDEDGGERADNNDGEGDETSRKRKLSVNEDDQNADDANVMNELKESPAEDDAVGESKSLEDFKAARLARLKAATAAMATSTHEESMQSTPTKLGEKKGRLQRKVMDEDGEEFGNLEIGNQPVDVNVTSMEEVSEAIGDSLDGTAAEGEEVVRSSTKRRKIVDEEEEDDGGQGKEEEAPTLSHE